MAQISLPWAYVPDPTSGRPIALGQMYFGVKDLDPITNQIQLRVKQEDGTVLNVGQPLYTNAGGVPSYLGSPVIIDIEEQEFSLKVLSANGSEIYYNENNIPYAWGTEQIEDGAITTIKIEDGAVTTPKIADDAVDKDKIFSDVAGNGLGQNVDGSLEVNVDDSTIEINLDTVRVKAGGITNNEIGAGAIDGAKITSATINTLQLANSSVTADKLAAGAVNETHFVDPTAGNTYTVKQLIGVTSGFATNSTSYPDEAIYFSGGAEVTDKRRIGCTALVGGAVRIHFSQEAVTVTSRAKVFVNSVQQGAELVTLSGVTDVRSVDVTVAAGDVIQIIHRVDSVLGGSIIHTAYITSDTNSVCIG